MRSACSVSSCEPRASEVTGTPRAVPCKRLHRGARPGAVSERAEGARVAEHQRRRHADKEGVGKGPVSSTRVSSSGLSRGPSLPPAPCGEVSRPPVHQLLPEGVLCAMDPRPKAEDDKWRALRSLLNPIPGPGPSFAARRPLSDGQAARHYHGRRYFGDDQPCGSAAGAFC
jgi:hypothetical protein